LSRQFPRFSVFLRVLRVNDQPIAKKTVWFIRMLSEK